MCVNNLRDTIGCSLTTIKCRTVISREKNEFSLHIPRIKYTAIGRWSMAVIKSLKDDGLTSVKNPEPDFREMTKRSFLLENFPITKWNEMTIMKHL